jgi:hypothetical protein
VVYGLRGKREGERGDFLNAEVAKVSQRAQKRKYQKNSKLEVKNRNSFLTFMVNFWFSFLFVFFCALCETFATSAFKKSPYSPRIPRIQSFKTTTPASSKAQPSSR